MPKYVFKRANEYKASFKKLTPAQKKAAKDAFKIFKANPFDPRLKTHKINRLSALMRRIVFSVTIEADLRSTFYIDGNTVWSIDIGTHDIYK